MERLGDPEVEGQEEIDRVAVMDLVTDLVRVVEWVLLVVMVYDGVGEVEGDKE